MTTRAAAMWLAGASVALAVPPSGVLRQRRAEASAIQNSRYKIQEKTKERTKEPAEERSNEGTNERTTGRTKGRANELTLARLRPGVSTRADAEKLYRRPKAPSASAAKVSADEPEWLDGCTGRLLRLDLNEKGKVRSVTVSALGARWPDCPANPPDWLGTRHWRTGRGLALGAARDRVTALYGEPQSAGPSTLQGRTLELMFYAFDWAGDDVPQVLEVTLERGRVVQITLAFASL